MATLPPGQVQPSEFEEVVIEAIDELPAEFQEVLADVPIVISDLGHEFRAYGHYIGDTVARDDFRDHIVIYQDTLERDFGWNRDLLRAQIVRTVRHEVAHHLGWDEQGVRRPRALSERAGMASASRSVEVAGPSRPPRQRPTTTRSPVLSGGGPLRSARR